MHQAIRIDKRDVLRLIIVDPEDIVRIEIPSLKEAHTDLAFVTKQVQRLVFKCSFEVSYYYEK